MVAHDEQHLFVQDTHERGYNTIPIYCWSTFFRTEERVGSAIIKDVMFGNERPGEPKLLEVSQPIERGVIRSWGDYEVAFELHFSPGYLSGCCVRVFNSWRDVRPSIPAQDVSGKTSVSALLTTSASILPVPSYYNLLDGVIFLRGLKVA